mmetsp:Transcript_46013/g.74006  ORF Transcript_46013/g.74006 Transcript_46013/m.74006 type:complete len:448 (+) Transcript_46013:166-1509(+)
MSDIVHKIIGLSSSSEDLKELSRFLSLQEKRIRMQAESDVVQWLAQLDPSEHTIGYLRLLVGLLRENLKDLNSFKQLAARLLKEGKLKSDRKRVYQVARQFVQICLLDDPMFGIRALRQGIGTITGGNDSLLTPLHTGALHLCIKAKAYGEAKDIVSASKIELEQKRLGFTIRDYLGYYYYAGHVCCVIKNFRGAFDNFLNVLTAPTEGCVSKIQVYAYQRYVIVSLLEFGEVKTIPKQEIAPKLSSKLAEAGGAAYSSLKHQFNKSAEEFQKYIDKHKKTFEAGDNWGLCKQLHKAVVKRKIQKLQKTYISLSFEDVAKLAKLKDEKEAQEIVAHMIEDGEINARICCKERTITFAVKSGGDSQEIAAKLKENIREVFELYGKLQDVDHKIKTNVNFIKKNMPELPGKDGAFAEASVRGGGNSQFGRRTPEEDMLARAIEKSRHEK